MKSRHIDGWQSPVRSGQLHIIVAWTNRIYKHWQCEEISPLTVQLLHCAIIWPDISYIQYWQLNYLYYWDVHITLGVIIHLSQKHTSHQSLPPKDSGRPWHLQTLPIPFSWPKNIGDVFFGWWMTDWWWICEKRLEIHEFSMNAAQAELQLYMGKPTLEQLFGPFPWSSIFFCMNFQFFFHKFNFFYPELHVFFMSCMFFSWVSRFLVTNPIFTSWISCLNLHVFFPWISFF